jgi:hypothetical protein
MTNVADSQRLLFSDELMKKRLNQFSLYLKLKNINKIVDILIQIKDKNELTENFDFLEQVAQTVIRNSAI